MPNNLCFKYIFTISGHIYRPLWTYYAPNKIDFVFYASSFLLFENKYGTPPPELGFKSMTWPRLFMWDTIYAEWTTKLLKNSPVQIIKTKSIWYSDAKFTFNVNIKSKNNIILFDVPPLKISSYLVSGSYPLYRTFRNGMLFLEDIYRWALMNNINIIFKKKRGKSLHSNIRYLEYTEFFALRRNVTIVDSNISPYKLIKEFGSPVISAPFTSTAFIAKELGVPSFFYDPTEKLFKNDRGCQGVQLISGVSELDIIKSFF